MEHADNPNLAIRKARIEDRDFIISLVPRLVEFGPPVWRDPGQMTAGDRAVLQRALSEQAPDTVVFIADDSGTSRGFVHLTTTIDYYTHEEHGQISDLAVTLDAEGHGIARVLIGAAEDWAINRGYRLLTLNVFVENHRAREFYRHLGYGEDTMRYVKELKRIQ